MKFFIAGFGFAWVAPTSGRLFLTRRHQAGASAVLLLLRPRILKDKSSEKKEFRTGRICNLNIKRGGWFYVGSLLDYCVR
jgi:hypothetical protein